MSLPAAVRLHDLPVHRAEQDGVRLAWIFTDVLRSGEDARIDAILSLEERARAAAHRQPGDRASYRAAHALKRLLLAEWLGCAPGTLRFARTERGKPYLVGQTPLEFSISHCAGLAVLACAADRAVGIDAERTDGWAFDAATAQTVFHPAECAFLATLDEADRPDARYALWLLREAHAKATGLGLADQGEAMAFALNPPRILHGIRHDKAWRFSLRRAGAHHMIALAAA